MELVKRFILAVRLWIYEARFYLKTGLTSKKLKRLWIALMEASETKSVPVENDLQLQLAPDWRVVQAGKYKLLALQTHVITEDGYMVFIRATYDDVSALMIYTTTKDTDWQLVLVPQDWENKFIDGQWRPILKALCKELL